MPIFYYIEEGRKDFIMKKRKRILTALAVSIAMLGQTFLVSAEDLNTQTVQTETVSETAKGSNSESTVESEKSVAQDELTGAETQDNNGHIQGKKIQTEKRQRKGYKKNNGTVKEQTHKKGERRQAARKTRSKPQPDKPVKGRRTLY